MFVWLTGLVAVGALIAGWYCAAELWKYYHYK